MSERHRLSSIFAGACPYSRLHDAAITLPTSLYLPLSVFSLTFSPSSSPTSGWWCTSPPLPIPGEQLTPATALAVPLRTGRR